MRKTFAQVLQEGKVDIKREYYRLFSLFFDKDSRDHKSLYDIIANNFDEIWFRGTAISLDDFNEEHGFDFSKKPEDPTIDDLVCFSEYFYNLIIANGSDWLLGPNLAYYTHHVSKLLEHIGYIQSTDNGITIFVEKDPVAISVAELLPEDVSYKVISYHHHSMNGNLNAKKETLLKLAELLEPKDKQLHNIDDKLKSDLFNAFNNLNLRHNNIDPNDKGNYRKYIAEMDKSELEKWYDEVYQMCLLAFLLLEQAERKPKFDDLMKKVNSKEKV